MLGQRLKLAGGSSSGDVGPIVISADPAPFGRYRRIATKHLDRNRTLVFPVRPDRNTHYKFETPRVGGGRVLHIFVSPRTKLIPVLLGPDRARLTNTAKVRPGARVRLPRVFFYFHRRDVRRYRLLGSAQAVKAGRDTVRAQLDFTLSAASLALIPPRAG